MPAVQSGAEPLRGLLELPAVSRILFAWEFGGGIGHIRRLLPVARALRAMGREVSIAFREPALLSAVQAQGFEGFAAPRLWPVARRDPAPANHSVMLLDEGFGDVPALRGALRAWDTLLAALRPSVLVCDYAPTAVLAGRLAAIPVVTLASGFALPPDADPLPALRPWDGAVGVEELRRIDARLLRCVAECASRPVVRRARELFSGDVDLLCAFAELDPFGPRRDGQYLGATADDAAGMAVQWRAQGRPRVFAYLRADDPRLPMILAALDRQAAETIAVVRGAMRTTGAGLPRVRVHAGAVALEGLLDQADLCVSHGGAGLVSRAWIAGVPSALLPVQVEQAWVSRRAAEAGAAAVFSHERALGEIDAWLAGVLDDRQLAARAREGRERHRGFSFDDPVREAARRIAQAAG